MKMKLIYKMKNIKHSYYSKLFFNTLLLLKYLKLYKNYFSTMFLMVLSKLMLSSNLLEAVRLTILSLMT